MKAGIHPDYTVVNVHCACGATWTTRSTKKDLRLEICSSCHPVLHGQAEADRHRRPRRALHPQVRRRQPSASRPRRRAAGQPARGRSVGRARPATRHGRDHLPEAPGHRGPLRRGRGADVRPRRRPGPVRLPEARAKESKEIAPIVERYRAYKDTLPSSPRSRRWPRPRADPELREMAHEEARALEAKRDALDAEIPLLLIPKDPNDEKNVLLEIRAGTGGDEAALFAAEMFRMYARYAERQGWKVDVISLEPDRPGRHQGSHRHDRGRSRVLEAALRERRPPRAARAGDRGARAASTPRRSRSPCCPRPRRSTSRSRPRTCASTPSARPAPAARASTRPTRRCASPTSRPNTVVSLPGREEPDQEPREGDEGPARAALRGGARGAAEGDRQRPQEPGRQRRPLREDPHLQLPAEPRHRPPHRPHDPPPPGRARRRPRRDRGRPARPPPGREAQGQPAAEPRGRR